MSVVFSGARARRAMTPLVTWVKSWQAGLASVLPWGGDAA